MILIDRIVTLRSRSPCGERGLKLRVGFQFRNAAKSLPVRGAWIEISLRKKFAKNLESLPVRGAWIEIMPFSGQLCRQDSSLPVRGAWIEIIRCKGESRRDYVAPRAGSVD